MKPFRYDATRTSLTLSNGASFDLLDPKPERIDFNVIVHHLAKANRYCGATPGLTYSVAEHSVRCANAVLYLYERDAELAAYLLCHDMHEALLGDDTTPKKRALAAIIGSFGVLAGTIERAFASLTERIDAAIHQRAGLAWPPPPDIAEAIHMWDRVLLATEWRDLMKCPPPFDFGADPLPQTIVPHQRWQDAEAEMRAKCIELLGNRIFQGGANGT